MSKRLKRRIREVCGLDSLNKEERVKRVHEILNDTAAKQAICNQVVGTSFKDIERALRDVISDKKSSKQQQEYEALLSEAPQKLFPELDNKRPFAYQGTPMEELLDPEECNKLVQESLTSKAVQEVARERDPTSYPTYSFEEVAALVEGNYHPAMFKKRW